METTDVRSIALATPDTRDRYVDLLRVGSLAVVVLGHWLMAVVSADGETANALALLPWLQPATWLLQVMAVFFLVGGFSHALTLRSVRRRGGTYADFVRSRAGRLLRPTAVFAAVWLAAALAIELAGRDEGVLALATRVVAQPLWFVGVYLGLVALAPVMLRAHERYGVAVPTVLGLAAVAVDVARFRYDVSAVGFLNVAFVWLAVHQLGFLYADGRLSRRTGGFLAVTGLVGVVALTTYGPYPVSMVGLPGDAVSNMSPPTVALCAQALLVTGLVLVARPAVSRWLQRPRVWAGVVTANGVAMTAFLWHLSALFVATAAAGALRLSAPEVGSGAWWVTRPVWVAVLAAVTVGFISVFRRADRPRPVRVGRGASAGAAARPRAAAQRDRLAAGGVALCVAGVLAFSAVGFGGLLAGRTASLVVLDVTPLTACGLLVAGGALVRLSRP